MVTPRISVIVPVYNVEKYLPSCIESVLAQTYTDYELLLIDDGSSDGSSDICDNYAQYDARIKVFHKENGGVSHARNYGLQKSIAEFVCFIDSDDVVGKDYLLHLMSDASSDLVVSGLTFVSSEKEVNKIPASFFSEELIKIGECIPALEYSLLLNGPCQKRYKRKIIVENHILFDHVISSGEDTVFVFQYMEYINSLRVCSNSDYRYNMLVPGSLTKRRPEYSKTYYFANLMYGLRRNLIRRFVIRNKRYIKYVDIIFQEYVFMSIYSLYYQKINKEERIKFLKNVYKKNSDIRIIENRNLRNTISALLMKLQLVTLSDKIYSKYVK